MIYPDKRIIQEVKSCMESMTKNGLEINLNNLLICKVDYQDWTYFDELAHRIIRKYQNEQLTDEEIMFTLKCFKRSIKQ